MIAVYDCRVLCQKPTSTVAESHPAQGKVGRMGLLGHVQTGSLVNRAPRTALADTLCANHTFHIARQILAPIALAKITH
jgi:hypothetical protein